MRIGQIAAILAAPLLLLAYSSNPPAGESGATVSGGSSCGTGSCHFHGTSAASGGVTANLPATYTPGGPAMPITVTLTTSGGFEMSAVQGASQAGSFTAGTGSAVSTLAGIQYILHTNRSTSFAFTWTPPATNVGPVTMNLAGVSGGLFSNTYTLTPASAPPTSTLTVAPSALTFNYTAGGAVPAAQTINATSSGMPIAFTTGVSTTSGGTWLTATPPGANTPMGVSVSVSPASLPAGTYTGMVTITASGATNSPQTVNVTLKVTGTVPPALPTLKLTPTSLTFDSTGSVPVAPMNVQVTSSGSPLLFTAAAATSSGGNWLSVGAMSGTTPAAVSISANPSSLPNGTYHGSVTFSATGASNSPQPVNVTLTVGPATPPPTTNPGSLTYNFSVLDKQSDGADHLMLDGQGSYSNSQITGGGNFTRFTILADGTHQIVSTGKWTAKSLVSYSPASAGSSSGGVLELNVELDPAGGAAATGSMRIASTGEEKGVTLAIDGVPTFVPTGTGSVSITGGTSGGGSCVSPRPAPIGVRPPREE